MYNLPAKLILQLHIVVKHAFLTDFIGENLLSIIQAIQVYDT